MKKDSKGLGLVIPKRIRVAGTTFYVRQGQVVGCPSKRGKKKWFTLAQLKQRLKMRHSTALWKMLKLCDVMFTERRNACQNFMSLANRQLPVVYVPDDGIMSHASFLMPNIPVSDGTLPMVKLELGEVDGMPALITDLKTWEEALYERFLFYTAVQSMEGNMPRVRFSMREISRSDMTAVDGHYVLMDEEFADEMKGWALVHVINDRCSPQGIVTRCTFYKRYTTDEALEIATESYGGLTELGFLSGE
ncbi:MAG: hypothetical protein J6W52_01375 [Bacteroidaceae bacterium]|nr:hypothetical protein [Bacteroidaceae bacterium]